MFFINDSMAADSLKGISGRIQSKTGPIRVVVHASDPPLPRRGMDNGGGEGVTWDSEVGEVIFLIYGGKREGKEEWMNCSGIACR